MGKDYQHASRREPRMNYHVTGGKKIKGEVTTNISKNAAVALLCASLLNKGTTTLKRMPRIEELAWHLARTGLRPRPGP